MLLTFIQGLLILLNIIILLTNNVVSFYWLVNKLVNELIVLFKHINFHIVPNFLNLFQHSLLIWYENIKSREIQKGFFSLAIK